MERQQTLGAEVKLTVHTGALAHGPARSPCAQDGGTSERRQTLAVLDLACFLGNKNAGKNAMNSKCTEGIAYLLIKSDQIVKENTYALL